MVFYFSGTGNTQWVARQLAEATGEELVDMARDKRTAFHITEDERIGFCFPTHGWQPPRLVRNFIRKMELSIERSEKKPLFCYAVTTCGDNMGEAMTILNRELLAKGLQAETMFSVIMPESYVCLPFMHTDSEERVEEKIENAKRQMTHIIRIVKDRKFGIVELEQGATPRLYSYVIGGYFNRKMITDKKFVVDVDSCTRCGKCQRVCPVGNIKGIPPQWSHDGSCTMCLACYHHCPVHAINYGTITKKRGQYTFNSK